MILNDKQITAIAERGGIVPFAPMAKRHGIISYGVTSFGYDMRVATEPAVQYAAFEVVWDDGYGWQHWSASKPCWEQWLDIDETGRAVWK